MDVGFGGQGAVGYLLRCMTEILKAAIRFEIAATMRNGALGLC